MSSYVVFSLRNKKSGFITELTSYSRSNPIYECSVNTIPFEFEKAVKLTDARFNQILDGFNENINSYKDTIKNYEQAIEDIKAVAKNINDIDAVLNRINDYRQSIADIQEDLRFFIAQRDQLIFINSLNTYNKDYWTNGNEIFFGIEAYPDEDGKLDIAEGEDD